MEAHMTTAQAVLGPEAAPVAAGHLPAQFTRAVVGMEAYRHALHVQLLATTWLAETNLNKSQ